MGAWIEMAIACCILVLVKVAPCVGAWIEIEINEKSVIMEIVAPCVGAWIEMFRELPVAENGLCRTLRGCVD